MAFRILIMSAAVLLLITACENKGEPLPVSEINNLPSTTVENVYTVTTDSGRLQVILRAPLVEQYSQKEEPYTEFRKGMRVEYFDKDSIPEGIVSAKYARYDTKKSLWELRDSVVVINEKNDMLETELLFFDETKDLIYTDRFVKMTTVKNIVQGFGFESDSKLRCREIKKVSATIYYDEEE